MSTFVIVSSDGFYTGKSYIYQGEKFAVFDKNVHRAKHYSSFKSAENARKRLEGTLFFVETKVKEVIENEDG